MLLPHNWLPSPRLPSLRSSCTARRSLRRAVRLNPRVCPHHLCSWLHANPGQHHCNTTHARRTPPLSPHAPPKRTFLAARLPTPLHGAPCATQPWRHKPSDVAAGLRGTTRTHPIVNPCAVPVQIQLNARCALISARYFSTPCTKPSLQEAEDAGGQQKSYCSRT